MIAAQITLHIMIFRCELEQSQSTLFEVIELTTKGGNNEEQNM